MSDRTVLCVDDETHILNSLKRVLRREDYNVLTAAGGLEALEVLERERVGLVVTDQRMPGMTGVELLQRVKARWPDVVRIVLSGYAEADVMVDAINSGEIYRFLAKPWDDEELKTTIREGLEQHDVLAAQNALLAEADCRNRELAATVRDLENDVATRTRSLELTRDVITELHTPVVCVGREGFLISANRRARECYDPLRDAPPGTPLRRIFPERVVDIIERWLQGGTSDDACEFDWNGHRTRMHVQPLTEGDGVRGCVLTLEET